MVFLELIDKKLDMHELNAYNTRDRRFK